MYHHCGRTANRERIGKFVVFFLASATSFWTVIADGEVIDRGEFVVVVEVRGNRVLVRRASA
jgi:hypothetical protein